MYKIHQQAPNEAPLEHIPYMFRFFNAKSSEVDLLEDIKATRLVLQLAAQTYQTNQFAELVHITIDLFKPAYQTCEMETLGLLLTCPEREVTYIPADSMPSRVVIGGLFENTDNNPAFLVTADFHPSF